MKKVLLIQCIFALGCFAHIHGQNQLLLSEEWKGSGGLQTMFYRNVAKTDLYGNVYVAGSTVNTAGNYDIFIQKFDNEGYLLWDVSYAGAAGLDDMASDIAITSAGDYIYLTGTSVESFSQGADMILIKYADDGTLQWAETYDNGQTAPDNQDFGTSIAIDVTDQLIVVAGACNATGSDMDYLMNAYDDLGNLAWSYNYNYSGHDVAAKVIEDGGTFVITGLSQNSSVEWKVATVEIDASGTYLSENRTGSASPAVNEVYDLTVDESGNFYIAAAFYNELEEFNMTTLKLDNTLTLEWTAFYSGSTYLEDKAKSIKVDGAGNVYVAGYATEENKDLVLIKYNSSGAEVWKRTFDGGGDDEGVGVTLANGYVYVVGKTHNGSDYDFVTLAFTASGELVSQVSFAGSAGEDDIPNAITTDPMGNVIVTGQEGLTGSTKSAITIKYDAFVMDLESIDDISSKPLFAKNHIVIKFKPDAVNPTFIDNTRKRIGKIEDVLGGNTISDLEKVLDVTLTNNREVRLIKIFPDLTSADDISISRSGYPVRIPHFQSWLMMTLPNGLDADVAVDILLTDYVEGFEWAEVDAAIALAGVPNDAQYSTQSSLHPTVTYPDAHINMEDAWDVSTGQSWLKVGIVDNSIWWAHQDFGTGTVSSYQNTVVKGGWNFENNTQLPNLVSNPLLYGHGTGVASIIGAIRNNSIGIAGIAGGESPASDGVSLYDMRICCSTGGPGTTTYMTRVSNAVLEGAKSGNKPYNGLHILNLSVASNNDVNMYLFRNAIRFAHANGVTCVAPRSETTISGINAKVYPASMKDEWVLSVGGSTITGNYGIFRTSSSSVVDYYSLIEDVDVVAPADYRNIVSLDDAASGVVSAGGSSFSAAHATGLASLMMSYYNTNSNNYANLWPEDIENVMMINADDINGGVTGPGEDDYTGMGKINAAVTLEKLEKPYYQVMHFTYWEDGNNGVFEEYISTLKINEFLSGYPSSAPSIQEDVDRYSITGTIDHGNLISPSGTILGHWKAESYSDTWGVNQEINGVEQVDPFVSVEITSWSNTSATLTGNLYYIDGAGSGMWLPLDPNSWYYRMSYSVYVYDPTGESSIIEAEAQKGLKLFPNPAIESANLSFYVDKPQDAEITIIDINGKVIKKLPILHCADGWQTVQLDTRSISVGIYFVQVTFSSTTKTIKLVKQ